MNTLRVGVIGPQTSGPARVVGGFGKGGGKRCHFFADGDVIG